MLALSEPSKTRPYQAPNRPLPTCSVSMALPLPGSGLLQQHSPSPSPGLNRRTPVTAAAVGIPTTAQQAPAVRSSNTVTHERSHSDAALPVDLNAESSSVTSLANLAAMRKSHMSGSVTSNDSGSGTSGGGGGSLPQPLGLGLTLGIGLGIGLGADIDSGYCTQFNSHSNNATTEQVVVSSPAGGGHNLLTHHGSTESPPVAPRTRVPLYPHGTQGMPPLPPTPQHHTCSSLFCMFSIGFGFLFN